MVEDVKIEQETEKEDYRGIIDQYFETHQAFFKNDTSKVVFLEGVLVGFVLEAQRMTNPDKKGNEPFWGTLHDLRIDQRLLMELFPKAVNKLKQLGYSYKSLVKEISAYMQNTGATWGLTPVELSWYFSHGLASYQNFRRKKQDNLTSKEE